MRTNAKPNDIQYTDNQLALLAEAERLGIRVAVADWNPNGCNDILFVDSDSQILGGLDNALFGFNISQCRARTYQFALYGESMISESEDSAALNEAENSDDESQAELIEATNRGNSSALERFSNCIGSPYYHWENINVEDALAKLAVSPVLTHAQALKRFFTALKAVL